MILLLGCSLPGLGPNAGMQWDDLPSAGGTDLPPVAAPPVHVVLASGDGVAAFPVDVPDETRQALVDMTTRAPAGDRAWVAPLGIQTAGGRKIGDPVELLDLASDKRQTCTITGFALRTLGYAADTTECGTPELVATLDCPIDTNTISVATTEMHVWRKAGDLDPGAVRWPSDGGVHTLSTWTDGARTLRLAQSREERGCGSGSGWWAWVDERGRLGSRVDTPGGTLLGVVDVGLAEPALVWQEGYADVVVRVGAIEVGARRHAACVDPCQRIPE